jgi:hypothetical protein
MPISNFPAALQPIIQLGYLEREFEQALRARLGYRAIADRMSFAVGIGETLTKTRAGLKSAVTTPVAANANTNLDNDLSPGSFGVEQFTISLDHYAATTDLNMVTSRVGIASQFLQNAAINGEQAARSLDTLARNVLFDAYFGGNTRVRTTLGAPGPNVAVDDVRGFERMWQNGVPTPVGASATMPVRVGSNNYTLVGVTVDGSNNSSAVAAGGRSGLLSFSTSVTVADATAGNAVLAENASVIARPNNRATTAALTASDTLTMGTLLNAVATLRANAVPGVDGVYNCYLDPVSARQLFGDADFRQLFGGVTGANQVYAKGLVNEFLGLRFIPTNMAYVQNHPSINGAVVRRPIVCGQGALIEGSYAGMGADDTAPPNTIVSLVDGVAMVTREPIDRLQQIIAQSWYWIGGYCAPSDVTTTTDTVNTANRAAYKRAVMVEHCG